MQSDEANERKRCRAFALEQNQRLIGEAHRRIQQAEQMLTHPQLDAEQFERYKRLKDSALRWYADTLEHSLLSTGDFPSPRPTTTLRPSWSRHRPPRPASIITFVR